jgi:3-hydroxyisobutyrate dehydrogenase
MAAKTPVAFLGLGIMGGGMARRLLDPRFDLTVYNRSADKTKPLADAGAKVGTTPREAAAGAAIVISMVADDNASRGLWLGENGALAGALRGAVLIECSTLTVGWVRELGEAAAKAGRTLLDAPVTGSKMQAASGELNFLVGGPTEALKSARSVLAAMSKSIVHLGPAGSGALLKLINNFLCGVQLVSLAEAMTLIERSGLDRAKALEVLQNGAPGSPLLKGMSARMTTGDYTPNFLMRLMAKDLTYAIEEGGRHGVPLTTVTTALAAFNQAIQSGRGEQDFSAVVEEYRKTK